MGEWKKEPELMFGQSGFGQPETYLERGIFMLECKNLEKKYLGKVAVRDLSLSIGQGRICALLGPNGSGKTTWMKMVAGLIAECRIDHFFRAADREGVEKAYCVYVHGTVFLQLYDREGCREILPRFF